MTYRPDIDGLRAIAILLVVIFHFEILTFGKSGFIGVDVFFVISGFLITRIILSDLQDGSFHIGTFYLKRIRRLYPALLATLVGYLVAGYVLLLPELFAELGKQVLLSLGYVVNFYFWQNVNYFGIQAGRMPLLHMWSLAIEEQFYLFFPLVMLLIWRFWRRGLAALLVVGVLASFGLGVFAASWKPEAAFYLLPTRAWELLLGGLLAVVWRPGRMLTPVQASMLGLAGLAAILIALVVHTPVTRTPGGFTLLPTLGTCALLIAGFTPTALTTRVLGWAPMVWIGKISYPLYLVHWPVLILQKDSLPTYDLGDRFLGLGLSVLLAWVIFRAVEQPVRRGVPLSPVRTFGLYFGTATGLAAVLSALVFWGNGLPSRFSPETQDLIAYRYDVPDKKWLRCEESPNDLCILGDRDTPMDLLILGDSHANSLAPAFDLWLASEGRSAGMSFATGCPPLPNLAGKRCAEFARSMLQAAVDMPEVNTIVLVSIWRYGNQGILVGDQWVSPPDAQAALEESLSQALEIATGAGKRLVVIEPLFGAPRAVPYTLAKNRAFGRDWSVDTTLQDHREQFAHLFSMLDRLERDGLGRISLIDDLCADGTCYGVYKGRPVFADSNHLTAGMSPVIAEIMQREFARLP